MWLHTNVNTWGNSLCTVEIQVCTLYSHQCILTWSKWTLCALGVHDRYLRQSVIVYFPLLPLSSAWRVQSGGSRHSWKGHVLQLPCQTLVCKQRLDPDPTIVCVWRCSARGLLKHHLNMLLLGSRPYYYALWAKLCSRLLPDVETYNNITFELEKRRRFCLS